MLLDRRADPNRAYPESSYGTALQAACYEGTLENVQLLIGNGANVDPVIFDEHDTPLQAACIEGTTEIVKLLLERGANPNTEGGRYGYAIIAACESGGGDDDMLKELISRGANVNVRSADGETPLTSAAMELPKPCVETLINYGAFIHTKDGDNDTALTNAACAADEECVRYLLEQGLDVQHIGDWGGALYKATESKALDCVNTLLEYCVDVNQKGGALHTPLQMAAYQGDVELVERFCNHGADIHTVGGKYHTALQAAVAGDSIETARLLLNAGADPNENGGEYGSALHAAIHAEEPIPLIDLLLEHKADINAVSERGTPLQLSAAVSTVDIVTHLLENGAQHGIIAGKYGTALQSACFMDDYEVVDVLVDRGADPFLRGGYYQNAFIAAALDGIQEYVQEWLPHVPEPWILVEALHYAIHFREKDVVKVLLDHGVDINVSSTLYGSAMEALEAGIDDIERKQKEGDLDFWYHYSSDEEDEDDSEEEEDDDDDVDDDESEDGSEEDDDVDQEAEAEAEAKAEAEIKTMLQRLLETNPPHQSQACQSKNYTCTKRKPLPSGKDTVPIPATYLTSSEPSHVMPRQDAHQVPNTIRVDQYMHTNQQPGFGAGDFGQSGHNGSYQQSHDSPWRPPSDDGMRRGRHKLGFKNAFKSFIDDVL